MVDLQLYKEIKMGRTKRGTQYAFCGANTTAFIMEYCQDESEDQWLLVVNKEPKVLFQDYHSAINALVDIVSAHARE